MNFARAQLEKYGWTEGKGLGANEGGILEALKPKLKFDTAGIGHDPAEQFTNHWWEQAYNLASDNIQISSTENGVAVKVQDKSFDISTKKYTAKSSNKGSPLVYGNFLKTSTLTGEGQLVQHQEVEDINESQPSIPGVTLTDEELLRACGGLTAHKGARHGLTLSGKLSRIREQEQKLLKQAADKGEMKEEDVNVQNPEIVNGAHTHKKKKKTHSDALDSNLNGHATTRDENIDTSSSPKKKKTHSEEITSVNANVNGHTPVEEECILPKKKMKKKKKGKGETDSFSETLDENDLNSQLPSEDLDISVNEKKKKKKKKSMEQNGTIGSSETVDEMLSEQVDEDSSEKKSMQNKKSVSFSNTSNNENIEHVQSDAGKRKHLKEKLTWTKTPKGWLCSICVHEGVLDSEVAEVPEKKKKKKKHDANISLDEAEKNIQLTSSEKVVDDTLLTNNELDSSNSKKMKKDKKYNSSSQEKAEENAEPDHSVCNEDSTLDVSALENSISTKDKKKKKKKHKSEERASLPEVEPESASNMFDSPSLDTQLVDISLKKKKKKKQKNGSSEESQNVEENNFSPTSRLENEEFENINEDKLSKKEKKRRKKDLEDVEEGTSPQKKKKIKDVS